MDELNDRPSAAVVGAGPAGLMAAEVLARGGVNVTVFERMPSPGRKLLLAGRGGLNLTHGEDEADFLARYGAAARPLAPLIARFGATALRAWCADLGIATVVGTSGRVFPTAFKTSPLLRAWLRRLDGEGASFKFRHLWRGWDARGNLLFEAPDGPRTFAADTVVLALGGASWAQLGSDGSWVAPLAEAGVDVVALRPANCGFVVAWSDVFRERFEGEPLKNIGLAFGEQKARGDAMVTRAGLEGGAVYALAPPLREAIAAEGGAALHIALRPDLSHAALAARLGKRKAKQSLSNALRKTLGLAPVAIGLLREGAPLVDQPLVSMDADALARLVNAVPIRVSGPMPIARAISTAGGVSFTAVDASLMLCRKPGVFVAGEMLDWEAPTGGYLLQACFATGRAAGQGALDWLQAPAKVEPDAPNQIRVSAVPTP